MARRPSAKQGKGTAQKYLGVNPHLVSSATMQKTNIHPSRMNPQLYVYFYSKCVILK